MESDGNSFYSTEDSLVALSMNFDVQHMLQVLSALYIDTMPLSKDFLKA